jgi:hypothetical protein
LTFLSPSQRSALSDTDQPARLFWPAFDVASRAIKSIPTSQPGNYHVTDNCNPELSIPVGCKGYYLSIPCEKHVMLRLFEKSAPHLNTNNHRYNDLEIEDGRTMVVDANPSLAEVLLEEPDLPETVKIAFRLAIAEAVSFSLVCERSGKQDTYIMLHKDYANTFFIDMTYAQNASLLVHLGLGKIVPNEEEPLEWVLECDESSFSISELEKAISLCPRASNNYLNLRIDQIKELCAFLRKINLTNAQICIG